MTEDSFAPWESSAVLVWTNAGGAPEAVLDPMHVQTPPHPNPVPFWRFGDAVEHAMETLMNGRHHGKEPWIKAGDQMFGQQDIEGLYRTIVAARGGR